MTRILRASLEAAEQVEYEASRSPYDAEADDEADYSLDPYTALTKVRTSGPDGPASNPG